MNIAIIGYGVVGGGVHALLADGGLGIRVRRVLDVRPIEGLGALLTDNIGDIISDPAIDCVVEAMGGLHPALGYVTASLRVGKHVVTSNKELISHALAPLLEGAALHGARLCFGACVGGGVPIVHNLLRQKRGDTILSAYGVVNGTTNFILDAMARGDGFGRALARAQALGYAEADASADISGLDTRRKCAIVAALAFDAIVEPDSVPALGIEGVTPGDMAAFAGRGLACKLLMHASRVEGGVAAYVEPTLLSADAMAAHTPTNHNCISLCCAQAGHLAFFGQGAGRFPTAETVVQDLLDIASAGRSAQAAFQPLPLQNGGESHPYYVRAALPVPLGDVEPMGPGVLTGPMPVDAFHGLAARLRKDDPTAFFAGVPGL